MIFEVDGAPPIGPTGKTERDFTQSQYEKLANPDLSVWVPDSTREMPPFLGNEHEKMGFESVNQIDLYTLQKGDQVYLEGKNTYAYYLIEIVEPQKTIRVWRDKYGSTTALVGPISAVGCVAIYQHAGAETFSFKPGIFVKSDGSNLIAKFTMPYFEYDSVLRQDVYPPIGVWEDEVSEVFVRPAETTNQVLHL